MSMVRMPLLIKAKMTEENYRKLLEESMRFYNRSYLRKHYRYDGTYFTLDICEMDDLGVFVEAKRIASYTEGQKEWVGYIYSRGSSFSVAELYFAYGCFCLGDTVPASEQRPDLAYAQLRDSFLSRFPCGRGKAYDAASYLPVKDTTCAYSCIALSLDALEGLLESQGYHVEEMSCGDSHVEVLFSDHDEAVETVLARYYHCQQVFLLPTPEVYDAPGEVLLILKSRAADDETPAEKNYRDFYDRITALHDCNDCGIRGICKFSPRPGQTVRINCPLWVAASANQQHNGS